MHDEFHIVFDTSIQEENNMLFTLVRKFYHFRLAHSKNTTTWYYPDGSPFTFTGRVVEHRGRKMIKP